ncbi:DUF1269 domain-containing protein [Cellulomonas wangsupingiae]|uniref:DUF1269 domain-containing protein n=1 Tax=Cellulomonas wangsupingiae TaxID=2968085 RepID=A0ABY5K0N9_9CELL|nr:DUF1269 domain-containing protein [Cellulomonas wangsupingiae]MCC2333393.1 DUF1269 domain-containing protein [Cellulomonas wangsupingiae]UUI63585.1 DUF1269 domain-containing protein [Cellulomonas wangsupingiae]
MTTFTVWKFDDPERAQDAARILADAEGEGLVHVVDRAVLSWPTGASRPTMHHARNDEWRGTAWGALWGLIVGGLFFLPVLGAAAGAAIGAIARAVAAVGITKEQLETVGREVTPGTSALFAVTEDADLDRLGERFHGLHSTLVSTNLTPAESAQLIETFG